VLVYAVAALGLNLLVGYSGQISLGHGAFFAIGAYTAATLIAKAQVPYPLTVPAAALLCFALGYAFGVPALRLRGPYLALVTLALAIATPPLIKRFEGLTGGVQGMSVPQPAVPGWLPVDQDQFLYLLVLSIVAPMPPGPPCNGLNEEGSETLAGGERVMHREELVGQREQASARPSVEGRGAMDQAVEPSALLLAVSFLPSLLVEVTVDHVGKRSGLSELARLGPGDEEQADKQA
jgi:hypothetical protein